MLSMSPYHDEMEGLLAKIRIKSEVLFREKDDVAPLYVSRNGVDTTQAETLHMKPSNVAELRSSAAISELRDNIFEALIKTYEIMPQFLKCVLTFGIKMEENEFEFPPFRSRKFSTDTGRNMVFESSYMLRRVELNRRRSPEDRHGWSIRQTAVYHQYIDTNIHALPRLNAVSLLDEKDRAGPTLHPFEQSLRTIKDNKSMFLLVSMSKDVSQQLELCVEQSQVEPWGIQQLLVQDSLKNWSEYMACLKTELSKQKKRILTADVGSKTDNPPTPMDIVITFEDSQELAELQDATQELQLILPALLQTIRRIHGQCQKTYRVSTMSDAEAASLEITMSEFEEFIFEAELLVERAEALVKQAESATSLISDLLSFEEAVTLKELAEESHKEGESMHKLTVSSHQLTKRSTQDAAAMKILTVITLIYLPTTIVANFFSTQFVKWNDSGNMQVAKNVWLLAVISIPLTLFTILLWWGWVVWTKVPGELAGEHTILVEQSTYPRIYRENSFPRRLLASARGKRTIRDEEAGNIPHSPNGPTTSGTFRSDASTVKEG